MVDVGCEVIDMVLDKQSAAKLKRYLKGCRVSFNTYEIEQEEICESYQALARCGTRRSEAVRMLATEYGKSQRQIRRIIAQCKSR